MKQRSVVCRNESGDQSFQCSGDKPRETEPCHTNCVHVPSSNMSPPGWERINNNVSLPEDHTIVIQDEYSDEMEEDDAVKTVDASESMKTIVGTNPK